MEDAPGRFRNLSVPLGLGGEPGTEGARLAARP